MSTEVVKRRGRPKKDTVQEVIVVEDEPVLPAKRPRASRKPARSAEESNTPSNKSTASLKTTLSEQSVSEQKTTTRATTARKPTARTAKKTREAKTSQPTSTSPSAILEQADAFNQAKRQPSTLSLVSIQETLEESSKQGSCEPVAKATHESAPSISLSALEEPTNVTVQEASAGCTTLALVKTVEEPDTEHQVVFGNSTATSAPLTTSGTLSPEEERGQEATFELGSISVALNPNPPQILLEPTTIPGVNHPQTPLSPALAMSKPANSASQQNLSPSSNPAPTTTLKPLHPAWSTELKNSRRSLPTKARAQTLPPPLPKLTELPYDALKRVPEYRSASRKVTSIMVAVPIALVTSYVLYDRCKCCIGNWERNQQLIQTI